MKTTLLLFVVGAACVMTGCSSMRPSDFSETARPVFDPVAFFTGFTSSSGVRETRGGAPVQIVKTKAVGRRRGQFLRLEQELRFGEGERQHRSWEIRRVDAHHFDATATDIIGVVHGEAYGSVFHWRFTLALSPGNPLLNVQMSQWMYLQPDGCTMINHSTITKAGVVVAQVTEQFRH